MEGQPADTSWLIPWLQAHRSEVGDLLGMVNQPAPPIAGASTFVPCAACGENMHGLWWDDAGRCQHCVDKGLPAVRGHFNAPAAVGPSLYDRVLALENRSGLTRVSSASGGAQ